MRALIQRVTQASVTIEAAKVGAIGPGMVILVCAMPGDTAQIAQKLALKISKLRIFADDQGRMNLSLAACGGAALIVSQFTLAADTSRGNRPGFSGAAGPEMGAALYQDFVTAMQELGIPVQTGQFGADMAVALVNDGPVTIWIDTND